MPNPRVVAARTCLPDIFAALRPPALAGRSRTRSMMPPLEARLFVKSVAKRGCREPDWPAIHHELKRPGVTQQLLGEAILKRRPRPEQGFHACLGILRLRKCYGPDRLVQNAGKITLKGDAMRKQNAKRLHDKPSGWTCQTPLQPSAAGPSDCPTSSNPMAAFNLVGCPTSIEATVCLHRNPHEA